MSKQLGGFLLGVLVGTLVMAALRRFVPQEAPPLRHSVVDPRLDQRLPTMAVPPPQPPPPDEGEP